MTSRLIDVHTHIYPPSYVELLSSRTRTPYVYQPPSTEGDGHDLAKSAGSTGKSAINSDPRLIILPSDDDPARPLAQRGRPLTPAYSSIDAKLVFMRTHGIQASVVSLANPWLEFLAAADDAPAMAQTINDDFASLCSAHPGRLFAFGVLPITAPAETVAAEVHRIKHLPGIKGVILGTYGRTGQGLDDGNLDPIWRACEETSTMIFIHPHYGLPDAAAAYGPRRHDSGHVLPLALGFPFETTIAFTRMYLAGVFDRFPALRVLLAHAGGTVPFLAGRIESCVIHEATYAGESGRSLRPQRTLSDVLRHNVWLDGVAYQALALRAAAELVGSDKILWGTDHPFFPPVGREAEALQGKEVVWKSVSMNIDAAKEAFPDDPSAVEGVLGGNAIRELGLEI